MGVWTLVAIDSEPTQACPGSSRRVIRCWAQCPDHTHPPVRRVLSSLAANPSRGCRLCASDRRRETTLVLPDGTQLGANTARKHFPGARFIVTEIIPAAERRTRVTTARSQEDMPVRDRARALLADGWAEAAVAEVLELEVAELRQLLRG